MPTQTTEKDYVYFADSAKVEIKTYGGATWTDIGVISGDITGVINYDEVRIDSANGDELDLHVKNIKAEGNFELINLKNANIVTLSGGLLTQVDTAASENTDIPDQTIAVGWDSTTRYELELQTSATDTTPLNLSAAPTITDIILNHASPETLVANADYVIIADSNSYSGYSIIFIGANMGSVDPTTYTITIDYGNNTPVATETLYAGTSSFTMTSYQMRITHTDSDSLTRGVEYYKVDNTSGGLQFNFKSANSDTVETMMINFIAKSDTSLSNGRQLLRSWTQNGAT